MGIPGEIHGERNPVTIRSIVSLLESISKNNIYMTDDGKRRGKIVASFGT